MTLQEFTVLCVVAHDSGRSLNELSALRRSGKSWSQVIKDLKGPLWDILLHGSARYRLKPVEPPEAGPETEQEILRLAQVMTLERLTGRGPAAIQRELDEGRDYAQLLAPNEGKSQPASVPSHNRHGRGKGWPPGLGDPGTPPASSGIIDSGGGRPSGR